MVSSERLASVARDVAAIEITAPARTTVDVQLQRFRRAIPDLVWRGVTLDGLSATFAEVVTVLEGAPTELSDAARAAIIGLGTAALSTHERVASGTFGIEALERETMRSCADLQAIVPSAFHAALAVTAASALDERDHLAAASLGVAGFLLSNGYPALLLPSPQALDKGLRAARSGDMAPLVRELAAHVAM